VVEHVYYRHDELAFDDILTRYGFSSRYFQIKFRECTGVSPKRFQRIARFSSVVRECLLAKCKMYMPSAMRHGYYDQPHFIREFEEFTGKRPGDFFCDKSFRAHFYNRSWGGGDILPHR